MAVLLTGILAVISVEKADFDADDGVLQSWRVEGNQIVQDGLGLSFNALPGWQMNSQPAVYKTILPTGSRHTRVWEGESAVFLQLNHPVGPGASPRLSTVVLTGFPVRRGSIQDALFLVDKVEADFKRIPGLKVTAPRKLKEVNGVELLTCEFADPQQDTYQLVVFRSGSFYLTLVLRAADDADRRQLGEFLNSIHVTGRSTVLNDWALVGFDH